MFYFCTRKHGSSSVGRAPVSKTGCREFEPLLPCEVSCESKICSFFIFKSMKYILIILGSICLTLGVIGIFLPLLPTTPFLLLAAALYVRSSEKLYQWLINQKYLGTYIRNFREHRAIPLRAKIISVSMVWITLIYCAIHISPLIWIKAIFILLATGITWHILSYKTLK